MTFLIAYNGTNPYKTGQDKFEVVSSFRYNLNTNILVVNRQRKKGDFEK